MSVFPSRSAITIANWIFQLARSYALGKSEAHGTPEKASNS